MSEPIPDAPARERRQPRAVVATALFAGLLAVGGWYVGRGAKTPVSPAAQSARTTVEGKRLFDQVMMAVQQRYVDSLGASELYDKAVSGMLMELGDPYTTYLSPARLKALTEEISGTYGGIGLNVNRRDGILTVIEPLPGSPADKAGVQMGDRLVAIEGKSTENMLSEEVGRVVRGPAGTKVSLTLERAGMPKKIMVTVTRDTVHRRAVARALLLPGAVAYVDINVFAPKTSEELDQAVDSLVKVGAKSLILDLRGNPGGLLEQGVSAAELFLDPGQRILELRTRPGAESDFYVDREPQRWPNLAIGVLLDHGSASSSEIVAGALQDHDRAIVVGTPSLGKGSAQTVFTLTNGAGVRLTTARWYTPAGRSISRPLPTEVAALPVGPRLMPDTTRPVFSSDAGRKLFGGGGILPDVTVSDSVAPRALQVLTRAMGSKLTDLRDAIAGEALKVKRSGAMSGPNAAVTPAMLNELYLNLEQRKVAPERAVYDGAAEWLARSLGYEMTRVTFGVDAEFLRRAHDDLALQRTAQILEGARTPREVFAHLETQAPATEVKR